MKPIKLTSLILVLVVVLMSCSSSRTVQAGEGSAIKNLMDAKRYVFSAQTVSPARGASRQLSADYDLRVSPDTLIAYLPYFGRAHVAPIDPSSGGIRFTSTNFTYTAQPLRKGRWNITMVPQDAGDVRELHLSVSQDGYASLQVLSNNREPITFNGIVTERSRR